MVTKKPDANVGLFLDSVVNIAVHLVRSSEEQRHDEQHNEEHKKDLCNPCERAGDTCEAEDPGKHSEYEERQ